MDDDFARLREEVDRIHDELERKVDDLTVAATMVCTAIGVMMLAAVLRVVWALT